MKKSHIIVVLFLVVSVAAGCEEYPGAVFRGTLQTDGKVTLPLSGKKVCAAQIILHETTSTGHTTNSAWTKGAPKWGSNARIVVDGEALKLGPNPFALKLEHQGDQWIWMEGKKVPDVLWGWGVDSSFKAVTETEFINHRFKRIDADEYFTNCGDEVVIRATREGDMLNAVNTNGVSTRNSLAVWFCAFLGFFLFLVAPMVLLIYAVLKRSKRKQNETG